MFVKRGKGMKKEVFDITVYKEACTLLQAKYGIPPYDYFVKNKNGQYSQRNQNNKKDKLEIHHIYEDKLPKLSNIDEAKKYLNTYPEAQTRENLCYCTLLEHAWLHILIAISSSDICEYSNDNVTLGVGGARILIKRLNRYYSLMNPHDKKLYEKIIDTYTNDCFIRCKTGKSREELVEEISVDIDGNKLNEKHVAELTKIAKRGYLFDWNVNCFCDLKRYLANSWSALVDICTGGGKTTTALEYVRTEHLEKNTLVLSPSTTITETWKSTGLEVMTFQMFMNCYTTVNWKKYSLIIADETHHIEAERWGEGIEFAHKHNPKLKLLGLTATPLQSQLNGLDKYFENRICYGLDLAEGIDNNNIYPFSYVRSLYRADDISKEYGDVFDIDVEKRLIGRFNIILNQNPVVKVLKDNMPSGVRKIIVFAPIIDAIPQIKDIMCSYDNKYGSEKYLRIITSKNDFQYNSEAKKWFNNTSDHDVCIITVGMVNEGAHYEGVNTLVMFRNTKSSTLFSQQLGRIVCPTNKPNPNGIVFDFTNNVDTIMDENNNMSNSADTKTANAIKNVLAQIKEKAASKQVIYKDYTEDAVNVLRTLKEAKTTAGRIQKISTLCEEIGIDTLQAFMSPETIDMWKESKSILNTVSKSNKKESNHKNKSNSQPFDSDMINKSDKTKQKISDREILYKIILLVIKRAYCLKAIEFDSTGIVSNVNEEKFNHICNQLDIIDVNVVRNIVSALGLNTYLFATL